MSTQLRIVLKTIGKPVPETEYQPLQVSMESSASGEGDEEIKAPFSEKDLATILRALEINRSVRASFTLEEIKQLSELGIIATEITADNENLVSLEEGDIHADNLLAMTQERLYQTLFSGVSQQSSLRTILYNMPEGEVLHLRLEFKADDILLCLYPWEVLSYANNLWLGRRVSVSRYIRLEQPASELDPEDKLNVVVVISRPKDNSLRSNEENGTETILAGLRQTLSQYQVKMQVLPLATSEELVDYLCDHDETLDSPNLFHFDGQGEFGRLCSRGHFNGSVNATQCTEKGCGRTYQLPRS